METDRHFPQRQDIPEQIIAGLGRRSEAAFEAVAQESTHGGSPQPLARVRPRHGRESVLRLVVFFGFQPATDVQPSTRSLRRRVSRPIRARRSAAGSPGGASKLRALMSDLRLRLSLPQRCLHRRAVCGQPCELPCALQLELTTMPERLHHKQQFAGSSSVARPLRSSLPASAPPRAEANVPSRSPNKDRRAAPH